MAAFADKEYLRRPKGFIAVGVESIGRDRSGHSTAGSVEESSELAGGLGSAGAGRDEGLRRMG